jgi:hypothetical protein
MEQELLIEFGASSDGDAAILAQDLASLLRDVEPSLKSHALRKRPDSLDFGTTLALLVGSPFAIAVARGLAAFLQRHSGVRISIKTAEGEAIVENADSRDAPRIAAALSEIFKNKPHK